MFKRITALFIIIGIFLGICPLASGKQVSAADYYPMACSYGEFEVSYVEDDGTFSKVGCYSSFSSAKKAMKENDDYVVRYGKSYSASKIVAMNGGMAYSYPARRNSATMNLYQDPNHRDDSRYKSTYVSGYYQMKYVDTCGSDVYDIADSGKGYIQVVLNGFEGFCDLEYTDLVPFKFIRKGIAIYLGGDHGAYCSYANESPYSVILAQDYYQIENNGNYQDLVYYYHQSYPSRNSSNCLTYSIKVDNACNYLQAGMKSGKKYYSADGIRFYDDYKMKDLTAEVYNYYQFLPLRTRTNISASVFNSFLKDKGYSSSVMAGEGQTFIDAQDKYGCNALIVYAMACLESAYGTSGYARNRNNLFGWSAYDDSPDDASYFSSVYVCVKEQMGRNLNWFMDYTNRRYYGTCVGNKGAGFNVNYASDPNWGAKIAAIAYDIDKYANNKNGNLSDHNGYALGFVKNNYNDTLYSSNIEWDPNIYKSYIGNDVLYTGRYGSHYQKDLIVVLLEENGSRYKIQSSNPVTDGSINTDDGVIRYDWSDSVGYIDMDKVIVLYGKPVDKKEEPVIYDHEPIIMISDLSLNGSLMNIEGIGAISCYDFLDPDTITHDINVYDAASNEKVLSIHCENVESEWFNINDGFSYRYAAYKAAYDLKDLPAGSYYLKMETALRADGHPVSAEGVMGSTNRAFNCLSSRISDDRVIRLSTNYLLSDRLELDVEDNQLPYEQINKLSSRNPMIAINEITYEEIGDDVYMNIEGIGMLYYLDYGKARNVSHTLYLVNDQQTIIADTSTHACVLDYKTIYGSEYDLDQICFTSKVKLTDLQGEYLLYLQLSNGEYTDLLEVSNRFKDIYNVWNSDKLKTSFVTNDVRYRLSLIVDKQEES